jgi:hypothetical protein
MTTTQLSLYNGALLEIGERRLSTVTDNVESRRVLDDVWDEGAVDHCLKQGEWMFASRSQEIAKHISVTPSFGFANAFSIPSDHIRTIMLATDEYFQCPLTAFTSNFETAGQYWYADIDPLYVRYVSNDSGYGGDKSLWTTDFIQAVQTYLASRVCLRLTQNAERSRELKSASLQSFRNAATLSAMEGPPKSFPTSSFVRARLGGYNRERGNANQIIG